MEYQIAIIDDDLGDLNLISKNIHKQLDLMGIQVHISQYSESVKFPITQSFDLIFLDIDMSGKTGFDLAKSYKKYHKEVLIVFITNHKELVYDACNIHPFDFIRKENILLEIPIVIEEAISKLNDLYPIITFYSNGIAYAINKNDILYCESFNHNTVIHYNDKSLNLYLQLTDVIKKINSGNFFRVHRSYYVNMDKVIKLDGITLSLQNNKKIQISRRKKSIVKNFLLERK